MAKGKKKKKKALGSDCGPNVNCTLSWCETWDLARPPPAPHSAPAG